MRWSVAPSNSAPYSSANPDPYPCSWPQGAANATATPAEAITRVTYGSSYTTYSGSAGSWAVTEASTVHLTLYYRAAPDSQNGHVKLIRWDPAVPPGTPNRVQTLFDQGVALTQTTFTVPGGGSYIKAAGSTTVDVAFSHLDNGTTAFGFIFSSNRPYRAATTGSDLITFVSAIPAPSVTYTVGGTVTGLTGSGLVLQNNGGDNLVVTTDGPFTFPTAIAAGASYSVTVQSQPSGQTCTVTNATGANIQADVTNVSVSCAAGGAWRGATLIETNTGNPSHAPTIAMDASGSAIVLWNQTGVFWRDMWANRYVAGSGWETATLIETDDMGAAGAPAIAMQANGNAIAVWEQPASGRNSIWANRYGAGTGWGTPVLLETENTRDAYAPKIAIDASGNAIAVWSQSDGTRNNIWANRYVAATGWGTATMIETDNAGTALYPRVATDANGNAMAVWGQSDGTRYNAWANRYVAGTGRGTATLIETDNAGNAGYPSIAMDTSGNAIAVWGQSDGIRSNVLANRYGAGTGWGTAVLLETDNAGSADPGPIVMDANGNAMVAWSQSDGARTNVWANRYVAGTGWGTATLIETDNAGNVDIPSIGLSASGHAVAVWHQSDGTRTNIWANRYSAGTGWGTASLIETDNTSDAIAPSVAVDASGNAIATWLQSDGTWNNVWANVFR